MPLTDQKKKVLILTYYWPPAGGPGVQRVLKFVKYLPAFGWEPIVLTVENGEYPALDPGLLREVPPQCKVYKTRTVEFFRLFKQLTGRQKNAGIETYILNRQKAGIKDRLFAWIRQNLFLPDARRGWVPFAVKMGLEIIEKEQPVLIFSSSPPHSLQLAAQTLAQRSGIPWVADFRDPWTDAFWEKGLARSAWAARVNARMERGVVQKASAITTVSNGVAELLLKGSSRTAHILPNGYDPEDFQGEKQPSDRFRIIYTGHIAASQNPENFFRALALLVPKYGDLLDIRFYGKADEVVLHSIEDFGLTGFIGLHGYIPHEAAIDAIMNADLLLLLIPKAHGKGILTGKLFEYLATRNPILGIGDESGAAAAILRQCRAGAMYDYTRDIAQVLEQMIRQWETGERTFPEEAAVRQYDRKRMAGQLAEIFDGLCN